MPGNHIYDRRIGIVGAALEHLQRIESYGVGRAELVMLPDEEIDAVRQYVNSKGFDIAIHSPLYRNCGIPEYPLLTSVFDTDPRRRERSLQLMERNLQYAQQWDAMYMVVHLQRPIAVLEEQAPAGWDEDRAMKMAVRSIEPLVSEAERVGIPIYIENMIGNPLFARPETYLRLFEAVSSQYFGMCFDIGHAALDASYYGFDILQFAEDMAPYIGSMHLQNNRIDDDIDFANLRHSGMQKKHPIHPSQSVDDGWIDVGAVVDAILSRNPQALPTLEVYYSLDTDREAFLEGLDWLNDICAKHWD